MALIACAIAVFVVIGSTLDGGSERSPAPVSQAESTETDVTSAVPEPKTPKAYTIELNDTLSAIAEDTGVSVERLLELNPELDPQALVAGQKIKLVE